jgi:lipopolysaccharide transport system ATP-binding protein
MPTAIKFENISKQYRLGVVSTQTLSHDLNRWWKMNIRGQEDPYLKIGEVNVRAHKGESEYVWALKDINFEVQQGDVLGIIGKNGAGKSTLLKILSKVTAPTTGTIKAAGRIASLLEVGTGFHPEMTGRENIYMNGAIMGMTKVEITRRFDEIVDFSGVERYIDTPAKRYSSGMTVRLGFAIAAHLEPEILVVDEVLAVGDAEFQKKAIGKMQDVSRGEGRTVLFVSHNMGSMQQLCTKGLLLQNGLIFYAGGIEDTVNCYLKDSEIVESTTYVREKVNDTPFFLQKAELVDSNNNLSTNFGTQDNIILKLKLDSIDILPLTNLLVTIVDKNQNRIGSINIRVEEKKEFSVQINSNFLVRGQYSFTTHVYQAGLAPYDVVENLCPFTVIDSGTNLAHLETFNYGVVFPNMQFL